MAKLLKLRRGTTAQHSSFTGAEGEVTVDTTKDTLVVHDGSTAGGVPLAKEAGTIATATEATNVTVVANNSTDETVYPTFVDGATGTQGIETDTGLSYNPSTGKLTATEFVGNIDAVNGDFDGTLEADSYTVDGTALNTYIIAQTVTNSTNAAHVLVTDNESTDEENLIAFVEDATSATGNVGLEMDGHLTYNPSSGTVTATVFKGNIDAVDGDFDGTLEADAITVGGTALNTVIAGVTVTNATNAVNATHVSVADNESTNENNLIPFIEDASATGNVGLESDGDFHYNPSTGLLSTPAVTTSGNVIIGGTLTVNGSTTTVSSTNTTITDNLIELNSGAGSNANDSGILIERGSTGDNAIIAWDESVDKFTLGTTTATNSSTGDLSITAGTLVANLEGSVTGNVTGNASGSAATLETARTIGGVSFDGSANIDLPGVNTSGNQDTSGNATTATTATNVTVADESSDTSCNVLFTTTATGNLPPKSGSNLTFNSSTGELTATKYQGDGSALTGISGTPTGGVIWFADDSPPTGFVKCNGAAISRSTYSDLFGVIGTTFGSGDGSSTFNVPELRGEFIRGWDDSRGTDSGRNFASNQNSETKTHNHTGNTNSTGAHTHNLNYAGEFSNNNTPYIWNGQFEGNSQNKYTSSNGNHTHTLTIDNYSGASESRGRNVALLACIKT